MTRWGTSYLDQDKPLTALSSYEGSRHEYYAQPQDMVSYKDRFAQKPLAAAAASNDTKGEKAGKGVAQLYVFRVVHLTSVTLESFIRNQGIEVLQVEEVSPRGAAYRSFMVTVHEKDAPTLLLKTFWPGLVSCKYWHDQVEIGKGSTLSRRSSARSNRRISSAHRREKAGAKPKKDDEKERPPHVLPPLETLSPKSKEAKSQNKKSQRKTKKTGPRSVTASKITKKKGNSRRGSVVKNGAGNDAQGSSRKGNKKEKTSKKNKSKNEGDKVAKDGKGKKKVKDSPGESKAKIKQTSGKEEGKSKDQASVKKKSSGAKTKETVKVRDTGKIRDSKGSGGLGKRQDNSPEKNTDKEKGDKSAENKKKGKENNDKRNDGKKDVDTKDRGEQTTKGKSSGHESKDKTQAERKSDETRQKPGSHPVNDKKSNKDPKEEQNNKARAREDQAQSTVQVNVKEVLVTDSERRSIGAKDRSSRIRNAADGSNSGRGYLYTHETEKDSSRQGYLLPEIPVKSPYLTSTPTPRSQEKQKESSSSYSNSLPDINKHRSTSQGGTKKHPNWVVPLSGLLILSSEETLYMLLGNDFDGLLSQDVISDDELFLGVKALAHASRAKASEEDIVRLVKKIWQPHVIQLIKTFTVTVERLYPDRAERYFWDLAEFLDLYVSRNIHIDQLTNLIDTCFMEVLALSYKSFLSEDIVKVFRVMQGRTKEKRH
ncbi:micronuclear linker histone polyprotein-like [Palaemon carinicauda]|uniref:micronuclear linker histone polyprotein-like n=1 Tax=Palaemon carinicauda TaxID=392227 RepID=UPI0035B67414